MSAIRRYRLRGSIPRKGPFLVSARAATRQNLTDGTADDGQNAKGYQDCRSDEVVHLSSPSALRLRFLSRWVAEHTPVLNILDAARAVHLIHAVRSVAGVAVVRGEVVFRVA